MKRVLISVLLLSAIFLQIGFDTENIKDSLGIKDNPTAKVSRIFLSQSNTGEVEFHLFERAYKFSFKGDGASAEGIYVVTAK